MGIPKCRVAFLVANVKFSLGTTGFRSHKIQVYCRKRLQ